MGFRIKFLLVVLCFHVYCMYAADLCLAQEYLRTTILNGVSVELPNDWVTGEERYEISSLHSSPPPNIDQLLGRIAENHSYHYEFSFSVSKSYDDGKLSEVVFLIRPISHVDVYHNYSPINQADAQQLTQRGLNYLDKERKWPFGIVYVPKNCVGRWDSLRVMRTSQWAGFNYGVSIDCRYSSAPGYKGHLNIPNAPYSIEIDYQYPLDRHSEGKAVVEHILASIKLADENSHIIEGTVGRYNWATLLLPWLNLKINIPANWQFNFSGKQIGDLLQAGDGKINNGLSFDFYASWHDAADNDKLLAEILLQADSSNEDALNEMLPSVPELKDSWLARNLWLYGRSLLNFHIVVANGCTAKPYQARLKGMFDFMDSGGQIYTSYIFTITTERGGLAAPERRSPVLTLNIRKNRLWESMSTIESILNSINYIEPAKYS